jgi:hypothetical protein
MGAACERHDMCELTLIGGVCLFQWPRGQRHRCVAARLLGLRVRMPPEASMSVESVVCCLVEVSETGRSLVQSSPTGVVCLCVILKRRQ